MQWERGGGYACFETLAWPGGVELRPLRGVAGSLEGHGEKQMFRVAHTPLAASLAVTVVFSHTHV